MPRYALISDVHGNFDALQAVEKDIRNFGVDAIYHLGDIVGYCAEPNECVDWVMGNCNGGVMGNHDAAVLDIDSPKRVIYYSVGNKEDIEFMLEHFGKRKTISVNPGASEMIKWTNRVLGKVQRMYLESLDYQETENGFVIVHGSLRSPAEFEYIEREVDASIAFSALKRLGFKRAFTAHSHIPARMVHSPGDEKTSPNTSITVIRGSDEFNLPDMLSIVNVGSVGFPRDDNPTASYVVYDSDNDLTHVKRVGYDTEAAAKKIEDLAKKGEIRKEVAQVLTGYVRSG